MASTLIELDGPRVDAPSGAAQNLVVLLHGLGADGNDLIQLAPVLGPVLPDTAFVAPNAPHPCDMAPFGQQWFSLQDRSGEALYEGVEQAAPILTAFLEREMARYDLTPERVALIGFSQGTMTALHLALRYQPQLGALVGFSGMLVGPEHLPDAIVARPPILLIHGDADEVVPPQALPAAEAVLKANRVPVETEMRPGLGHGIDETGLGLAARFLMRHLLNTQGPGD